ncbi:hypothetical protein B0I37DRAFT_335375, partial [Chaetomium sp. MPI-CAGE-AT-0009]
MSGTTASPNSTCLSGASPVRLADDFLCPPGFYCPNNTAAHPPEYCAPTTACLLTRLQTVNNICTTPQGTFEPLVCPPGFVCAPGGRALAPCPAGHFCPLGTAVPRACGAASICPGGAARQFVMDGFVVVLAVDVVLLVVCLLEVGWVRGRVRAVGAWLGEVLGEGRGRRGWGWMWRLGRGRWERGRGMGVVVVVVIMA